MFCIDRLPAIPLVASDPYLSIWMPADTMTQTDTCHWSGPAKPIRGVLTVDGAACRFLGEGAEPEAALTELKVTATRTRFVSEFGGVQFETTFATPALPDDLDLLSMPLTLVTFSAKATDGKAHDVQVKLHLSDKLCYDGELRPNMIDGAYTLGTKQTVYIGQETQKPLSHSADHITIDWGYLYLSADGVVKAVGDGVQTTCSLTVIGATDVTVKANGVFHAAISGEGDITCSGTVTLTTTGVRAMGSNDPLTYTPMQGDSYTVQLDDQTPFTRTGIFKESEVNLLKKVKSIIITPADSTPAPGPDDGDTTPDDTGTVDSGSDAGGAVAAVLVGGAAVWGGYEIATRVVLHNILPEGTAIPANRGQLALLVWNNAGRPEPAAQPAFADVADADMAKAAQWCVEKGIMEAKTAETFKPEGWIPKFKVIEVWNKAFPKQ